MVSKHLRQSSKHKGQKLESGQKSDERNQKNLLPSLGLLVFSLDTLVVVISFRGVKKKGWRTAVRGKRIEHPHLARRYPKRQGRCNIARAKARDVAL